MHWEWFEETWVPLDLKPRDVEHSFFTHEQLPQCKKKKGVCSPSNRHGWWDWFITATKEKKYYVSITIESVLKMDTNHENSCLFNFENGFSVNHTLINISVWSRLNWDPNKIQVNPTSDFQNCTKKMST